MGNVFLRWTSKSLISVWLPAHVSLRATVPLPLPLPSPRYYEASKLVVLQFVTHVVLSQRISESILASDLCWNSFCGSEAFMCCSVVFVLCVMKGFRCHRSKELFTMCCTLFTNGRSDIGSDHVVARPCRSNMSIRLRRSVCGDVRCVMLAESWTQNVSVKTTAALPLVRKYRPKAVIWVFLSVPCKQAKQLEQVNTQFADLFVIHSSLLPASVMAQTIAHAVCKLRSGWVAIAPVYLFGTEIVWECSFGTHVYLLPC